MQNTHDVTAEAVIYRRDSDIAFQTVKEFLEYMRRYNQADNYRDSMQKFTAYLWDALFSRSIRGEKVAGQTLYTYSDFTLSNGENIASRFQDFLNTRSISNDVEIDERRMTQLMRRTVQPVPSIKQTRSGTLSDYDSSPQPIHASAYAQDPVAADPHALLLTPEKHKPSYLRSTLTAALLGGVSRIAIISVLGASGLGTGLAVGVTAGVIAGAVTSYYKNRDKIGAEVKNAQDQSFWGRTKARWRGFRKSYSKTQFALNAGASALGVTFAPALFETIAENVPFPKLASDFMAAASGQVAQAAEYASALAGNINLVDIAHTAQTSLGNAIVSAEAASDSIRASVAGLTNMGNPVSTPANAVIETSTGSVDVVQQDMIIPSDPIMANATSEGPVVVIETPGPNPVEQTLPRVEEAVPLPVEETAAPAANDPIARAFADAGNIAQPDEQAVKLVHDYAQAYKPVPVGLGEASGAASAIEEELAAVSAVASESAAAALGEAFTTQHTVASGDRLWELAEELRGVSSNDADGHHQFIRQIMQANPELANPNDLKIGQVLVIPPESAPEADCRTTRSGGRYIGGCTPSIG